MHVLTSEGPARAVLHAPPGPPRGSLVLGHGAGGRAGARTADLLAVAQCGVRLGWVAVLVDQPWVLAGRRVAVAPRRLDLAWTAVVDGLRSRALLPDDGTPLVLGGRSAGARVACRTATALRAAGVLALAFPLHPPGRQGRSRAGELPRDLPTLVVQGARDRFGVPAELLAVAGPAVTVVGVGGDHALRQDLDGVRGAVLPWLAALAPEDGRGSLL